MSRVPPARSTRVGALDSMRIGPRERDRLLTRAPHSRDAITDQERDFFFSFGLLGIGFKAAAAASFVHARGADNYQLFALDQSLRVHRGISAAHADGKQLGDFFRDGQEAR